LIYIKNPASGIKLNMSLAFGGIFCYFYNSFLLSGYQQLSIKICRNLY